MKPTETNVPVAAQTRVRWSMEGSQNLHRGDELAETEVAQPLGVRDGPDLETRDGSTSENEINRQLQLQ